MIQRDKACRFKFPLYQGREITNSATDIGDDKTVVQAVARQQFTFVPPCHFRLGAQNGDESLILDKALAWIKCQIVDLNRQVWLCCRQRLEQRGRPCHHARRNDDDLPFRSDPATCREYIGEGREGSHVDVRQTFDIDINDPAVFFQTLLHQLEGVGDFSGAFGPYLARQQQLLICRIKMNSEG